MARDHTPRPRKNSEYRHLLDTGFYRSWSGMKSRCSNPETVSYLSYGGRGIKVCDRWQHFENFYDDMYASWLAHKTEQDSTTLERKDVNGDYAPNNCVWATRKEQSNNRRRHKMLKYKGKTLNLTQWAEELGIKKSTLSQRIYVYKWPLERALST